MRVQLPTFIRTLFPPFIRGARGYLPGLLKATTFWQDNYLILREFKYFPWIAVLAIVFPLLAAVFEGFGLGFLLAFLQSLLSSNSSAFHTGISWVDTGLLGVNSSRESRLYRVSALILLSAWIRAGFTYLTYVYTELAQLNLVARLNKRIYEQLQALELRYFVKTSVGNLINVITNDIAIFRQLFFWSAILAIKSFSLALETILMFILSWQLSASSVLLFTLLAVGLLKLNARIREASFPVSKANAQFTSVAMQFINGIRTVQVFATQDFERKRFYQASDDVVNTSEAAVLRWAIVQPLAEGLAATILIGTIVLAITVLLANKSLQVAELLTFLFILFRVVTVVPEINGILARLSSFKGSLEKVLELLRTDNKPYLENGKIQFLGLKRSIEFVSVDFGYDANKLVLRNITLTIERGQMTALVGASGAGKTTMSDLIPRLYDPTRGKILIDGVDLREFDINSVRRKIVVVSQDTFIFNASVGENIAYGVEAVDEAVIWEAAASANAVEFIEELPEGLRTPLGERGVRLSGGQRQRIALARALLRNPEILILDEATSALDSVSERLIQESLEKLYQGRTVIAIAHRLSTIVRADKVVVLEQGQIVEEGGYQELLVRRGKLWQYHQMQNDIICG